MDNGDYGPGATDEVTVPPTDPVREAKRRDVQDPADVRVDPEDLRDGGPTRTPGIRTTTGSSAGPGGPGRAGAPRPQRSDPDDEATSRVAPTSTGDATSGGMGTPVGATTSDATTGATSAGTFTEDRTSRGRREGDGE